MRLTYLLLSPTFGMHQYTADLANRMSGHRQVQLVTTEGYAEDRYGPEVAVYTPVKLSNTGLSPQSLRVTQLGPIKQALEIAEPDVVHITGPHLWNVELVRWLRRRRIPVVHTIHDIDPHHGAGYGRLLHVWNRIVVGSADHIIVHGEIYRQRLLASGVAPDKVTCTPLTHLFLSYTGWQDVERRKLSVTYEPIVLFFGRLEAYKGVDLLLGAIERLNDTLGNSPGGLRVKLIMAGLGKVRPQWKSAPDGVVEWRNRLIGDEEALDLFSRCAMVVLPYRDATQSALIAAAYYFRKPVIVTPVGALPEYVESGRTGRVIDIADGEAALVEAMKKLLKPGQCESLGGAGRAWYDEQRSRESLTLDRLYDKLTSRSLSASHGLGAGPSYKKS